MIDPLHSPLSFLKRCVNVLLDRDLFMREQTSVHRERRGSDYGGWWLHPDPLGSASVVYSFGVGDDVTFDLWLIQRFGLRVEAFDPTPRSIAWVSSQQLPAGFAFHPIGLADFDGDAEFRPPPVASHMSFSIQPPHQGRQEEGSAGIAAPVRRLSSIMRMLGHDRIDLLKMDIEGAEYAAIGDMVESRVEVRQILVEFHHGHGGHTPRQTREAVWRLGAAGFRIFAISPTGREYSFLKSA